MKNSKTNVKTQLSSFYMRVNPPKNKTNIKTNINNKHNINIQSIKTNSIKTKIYNKILPYKDVILITLGFLILIIIEII